jgi:hypothetical protein
MTMPEHSEVLRRDSEMRLDFQQNWRAGSRKKSEMVKASNRRVRNEGEERAMKSCHPCARRGSGWARFPRRNSTSSEHAMPLAVPIGASILYGNIACEMCAKCVSFSVDSLEVDVR